MGKYTGITSILALPTKDGRRGQVVDQVVIGTPGTIGKWFSYKTLSPRDLKILVFDEVDHMMADSGFQEDSLKLMRDIRKANRNIQILLFSATFNETVKSFAAKHTATHVCLIIDFCPGGELFALLDKQLMKIFKEESVRFYAAEVLIGLEYLHCLDSYSSTCASAPNAFLEIVPSTMTCILDTNPVYHAMWFACMVHDVCRVAILLQPVSHLSVLIFDMAIPCEEWALKSQTAALIAEKFSVHSSVFSFIFDENTCGKKLNMTYDEAERWIVNLVRNSKLDAKIDSKSGTIVMEPNHVNVFWCLRFLQNEEDL
ncbi:hypothetical protein IFM89_038546 [Coptis chinensis]|uniref:non-specific serine/threonine protein kinase n=1 Tax=Coptis chinensis TaxID=261450 RepID=A0A835IK24_9MAGN|nr:hypothetical protein IFM89_038546 [Coptis chinensis]